VRQDGRPLRRTCQTETEWSGDPATGGVSEHRALTDGREDVPGFRGQRTDKVGIGVANERG